MPSQRYELLRSRELRAALMALGDIAEAADSSLHFAQAGVQALSRLVASELTTLSRCDLRSARRSVVGTAQGFVGADERAAFDRHFREHPLVKYHAVARGAFAHRISDSLPQARFRQTALYNDYYRRVGLSHALALPVRMDGPLLVGAIRWEQIGVAFNGQPRCAEDRRKLFSEVAVGEPDAAHAACA